MSSACQIFHVQVSQQRKVYDACTRRSGIETTPVFNSLNVIQLVTFSFPNCCTTNSMIYWHLDLAFLQRYNKAVMYSSLGCPGLATGTLACVVQMSEYGFTVNTHVR